MKPLALVALALQLAAAAALQAADSNWPQWRGPNFNGSTAAQNLPANVKRQDALWSTPLPGRAGSTPVVWKDHVFLTSPDSSRNLNLLALDRNSGKILWQKEVATGDKEVGRNNMAAPSPVTDGKFVYTLFGTGDLAAFDFNGNPVWSRSLAKEFGRFAVMWIYGSSPLLFDGQLIVQVLQRDEMPNSYPLFDGKPQRESFLLSLDPATGKTLWRHVRKTDSTKESHESYATPTPYHGKNGWELLIVGGDHASGHDLKSGNELWRARLYEKRDDWYRIVTTPVAHNGLIFAAGPKGQPVVALRDGGKGDVTQTHVAWKFTEAPTDWATPLIYNDHLFVLDGGRRVLSKLDARSGAKKWSQKLDLPDTIWSSPTGADGKIYLLSENGTLLIVDAGDEPKLLGKLEFEEGPARSSVVVAHDQFFVRTAKNLYCFGARR